MVLKKVLAPAALLLLVSCISVSYVKTGQEFPPLAPGAEVKVFLSKVPPGDYREIGVVTVKGGSMDKRIEKAKEESRKHGGDGIIPRETRTISDTKSEPNYGYGPKMETSTTHTEVQEFVVVKLVERKKETPADIPGDGVPAADYKDLPRAGYATLLNDHESLLDKKFRGALCPVNFFRIPAVLAKHAGEDKHLLMMSTRTGKSKVLLFVPKTMEGDLRSMIEARGELKFVYTPVDVYRTKSGVRYPVLLFVDKIRE